MILAGDVGGTKTLIGLFSPGHRPEPLATQSFTTLDFPGLEAIVGEFLRGAAVQSRVSGPPGSPHSDAPPIAAASFGVAGPIVEQTAQLTNVPWSVDASVVSRELGIPRVSLLNNLQAMAYAVPVLEPGELTMLQAGSPRRSGNAALIAAGTGLGEALLHNVGGTFVPSATEGGHVDFAPRTDREVRLLEALVAQYGRAEYEHVLSGPGLVNIHRFVHGGACPHCPDTSDPSEAPAAITRAALERTCPDCVETLDIFVSVYGAEAGNLALHAMASAGVFIGGGIAPKILPALENGAFTKAFREKGPLSGFLAAIPVGVILNDRAGLLGAAVHASGLARRG